MTISTASTASAAAAVVRIFGAIALALALLIGAGAAARAQTPCTDHAEMIRQLESRYSEMRIAIGVANNGRLLEVFSSGAGGTWTVVLTTPNGVSCILIAGESWDDRRQVAEGPRV